MLAKTKTFSYFFCLEVIQPTRMWGKRKDFFPNKNDLTGIRLTRQKIFEASLNANQIAPLT